MLGRIPLSDVAEAPADDGPVKENGATKTKLVGVEGFKGLGIGGSRFWGEVTRALNGVGHVIAVQGFIAIRSTVQGGGIVG